MVRARLKKITKIIRVWLSNICVTWTTSFSFYFSSCSAISPRKRWENGRAKIPTPKDNLKSTNPIPETVKYCTEVIVIRNYKAFLSLTAAKSKISSYAIKQYSVWNNTQHHPPIAEISLNRVYCIAYHGIQVIKDASDNSNYKDKP